MLWADKDPPGPFPLHLRLPLHKGGGAGGGWREGRSRGNQILDDGLGEKNEMDGSGVCVDGGGGRLKKGMREGKMVGTHSFVLCEVVNGLAVLPGPARFVSVLIGLFHKRFCTIVIRQ